VFNAEVNNSQSIFTLLDNGSEGELFDHSLAHQPIFRLKKMISLYLADDKKLQDIAETTPVDLRIGEHTEQVLCYLVKLPGYKLIVGGRCRVVNSTASVQCKLPCVWTDTVHGHRSTVWSRLFVLLDGTAGGQFVLQFDLGTAV